VRVANELGAGNGKGAKFATTVSVVTSIIIGLFFWLLIMIFHNEFALIFSSSKPVLEEVNKLSVLLAFTIFLNSVQPVLSGNASLINSFIYIFCPHYLNSVLIRYNFFFKKKKKKKS
jgi:MATE family multidrug resistance protein